MDPLVVGRRDLSCLLATSNVSRSPWLWTGALAVQIQRECRDNTTSFLHEHEIAVARTRNCFRTNTKFCSHEHEINPARTRNETRIAARTPARNASRNAARNCPHEIFMRMSQAVSGFWGRSQARLGARKRVRGINCGAFSCGHSGRQLWGHFAQAVSRGQFRAGNSVRAISRPCVVPPAARARRLPPASQIACDWGAVAGCQRRPLRRAAGVKNT